MKKIMLAILLVLSGCSLDYTLERMVCTNFKTPWTGWVHIEDGNVVWREGEYVNEYKIRQGEICRAEYKTIRHNMEE